MLRSNGVGVLVNKSPAPASIALFSDDFVETQKNAALARIDISGSAADINAETVVQFEGNELVLDHGSLSVNTSRGMTVRVGCLTITPANNAEWTHYDVADLNGKVNVSALKNDVNIDERGGSPNRRSSPATPTGSRCAKASRNRAKKNVERATSGRPVPCRRSEPS
jgi:hypothetical protein